MSTNPRLSERQRTMLAAIRAGHTTCRAIGAAAGISSTSVVKYELEALADCGAIVLEQTPSGERVYNGLEYAAGWDSAARMAGNPDA